MGCSEMTKNKHFYQVNPRGWGAHLLMSQGCALIYEPYCMDQTTLANPNTANVTYHN